MTDKERRKFDIALINSCAVYWYMKNDNGTYESYMDRINDYLEWLPNFPSRKNEFNAMKKVKEYIIKYDMSEEFLRDYCSKLEHDNPRTKYNYR